MQRCVLTKLLLQSTHLSARDALPRLQRAAPTSLMGERILAGVTCLLGGGGAHNNCRPELPHPQQTARQEGCDSPSHWARLECGHGTPSSTEHRAAKLCCVKEQYSGLKINLHILPRPGQGGLCPQGCWRGISGWQWQSRDAKTGRFLFGETQSHSDSTQPRMTEPGKLGLLEERAPGLARAPCLPSSMGQWARCADGVCVRRSSPRVSVLGLSW